MHKSQKSHVGQKRHIKIFREPALQQIVFSKIHHSYIFGPHMLCQPLPPRATKRKVQGFRAELQEKPTLDRAARESVRGDLTLNKT